MREILFRGKVKLPNNYRGYNLSYRNGDWVYGLMNSNESIRGIFVDINTIGQYTGLTDKNGTKIFEGDIVLITRNTVTDVVAKIFYSEGAFRTNAANTYDGEEPLSFWLANDCDCEVIGNIYDNPEILNKE